MSNFEKACELSLNDWLATIPEVVPEAEYTDKHEKWLKKLFDKMRNNHYHVFTTKTIKVMLVAAVLCALLLTAFVIPSSREYIIDNFDIFSRYKITENNNNSVNGKITVGYIPDGFELSDKQISSKNITYNYINSNGITITFIKSSSGNEVDFDTEMGIAESVKIGEQTYTYFLDSNNFCNLVWNKNDYVYQLHSSVSKDELLKIAETVR